MSDTPSSESDAVAGFEAALGKSFGEAPPPTESKAPPTELDVPEELELKEPKEETPEEEEKPEAKTYKVKVDGREIEVAEDELLKGYSRDQDYRQKTMALAAERKQVQEVAQQVMSERQQYQAQLNQLTAALGDQLQQAPNWEELLNNDPVEYLKQQHLYQQRQAAFQNARQEQARFAQQTQEQQAQAKQEKLAYEAEQLIANLPAWKDPVKAQAEKTAIAKHLIERGFSPEMVSSLDDHKQVVLAREAMLYRQMMAKAKETTKAVEKLPPRMEKPGVSRPTDGRTNDMQALRKSGKAEDAAALFAKMF
jgi:ribosomal protein S17